jgi:ferredoxin-NADP reductase
MTYATFPVHESIGRPINDRTTSSETHHVPGSPVKDKQIQVRVRRRSQAASGVVLLELESVAGPLPSWAPGAHIDLVLDTGLVRQYSLCGDPDDTTCYRIAVLLEENGRGGSRHVHRTVATGAIVELKGPRNHFELEPASHYSFIAGGIGITPLLPMIKAATDRGAEWRLTYGGRSEESMAFLEELAGNPRVEIVPEDKFGRLDLRGAIGGLTDDKLVYCCGPEALLAAVEAAVGPSHNHMLRTERFAAVARSDEEDHAFVVELADSGESIKVEADQSILRALTEAGHDVPYSCEDGVCGSCETTVVDGRPDHRDSVMSPEEHDAAGTIQVCVSRSLTERLVIQL